MDEALNSIVPINPQTPYRMHDIVEMVVDKGSFLELQSTYAQNALIGLARIGGVQCGHRRSGTQCSGRLIEH